jgi:glycosyltransferase involved in cell wall biosynthesis
MKIAYFTDTYYPQINGVTKTLEKLRCYLRDNYIEYMFFTPEYPEKQEDMGCINDNKIKRFKSISFPLYPECRITFPIYQNLCRIADEFKPDLVHLITPFGMGLTGLKYARDRDIPIVSSYHTNFDSYLKYYKLEYLENIYWSLLKWFHSHTVFNFCPSHDTLKVMQNKGIEDIKIWARGIDTEKFNPDFKSQAIRRKLGASNKVVFLYVGRLAVEKDLDVLLESIKRVETLRPGKSMFVFTGDGPYASIIMKESCGNIVCTGYLKNEKLREMYASCDVFAFPSGTETFGNVIIEAMSSGLPVIAVNSGGVMENMLHEYNGLVCEPGNVGSFTEALIKFIDDRSLITKLGSNARKYSLTLTWDSVFSKLVADYYEAVKIKDLIGKISA